MKTTKQIRNNRISILFSLAVIILFPFISNAQLNLNSTGGVSVGSSSPIPASGLNVNSGNLLVSANAGIGPSITTPAAALEINGNSAAWSGGGGWQSNLRLTSTQFPCLRLFATNNNKTSMIGNDNDGGLWFGINGSGDAFGSYGMVIKPNGCVGIGTIAPTHQLELSVDQAWKPYTSTWQYTSDRRVKTNIISYKHGLDLIRQVKLMSYEYNGLGHSRKGEKGVGVIAQDFQNVFPNSVQSYTVESDSVNTGGTFLSVNLHELFIANIGAVQQLDSIVSAKNSALKSGVDSLTTIVKAQNAKIADLQNQISNCCTKNIPSNAKSLVNNDTSTNKSSNTMPILFQNSPNPFNTQTSIQYFIPATSQSASIMVFDLTGKPVKTIPITTFGNAAITINGNELSAGMFVYSLIVDGKIIDTKRMILTQ